MAELIPANPHHPVLLWMGQFAIIGGVITVGLGIYYLIQAKTKMDIDTAVALVLSKGLGTLVLVVVFGLPWNASERTDNAVNFFLSKDIPCDYQNLNPDYILETNHCKK